MKKLIYLAGVLLISLAYSQVGVNTASPKTTMDVSIKRATDGTIPDATQNFGLQAPRLTRAELTANTATYGADQKGALIYVTDVSLGDTASYRANITTVGYYYFDGTLWQKITTGTAWSLTGNANTTSGTNFLGTTDAQDFVIKTNGTERARALSTGNIGIGTNNPQTTLHVKNATSPAFRLEDGTQGSSKVLTSDANGNASWKSVAVPSVVGTLTSAVNTITNTDLAFTAASSPITTYYNTKSFYTGSTLTLPPGKWLVNVNMLLSKSANIYVTSGYDGWVTATFSDSSSALNMGMADFIGTNKIAGGSMMNAVGCAMMSGNIMLQNSKAANKTYYFWLRGVVLYNAAASYSTFQMQNFGTSNIGENQIIAYQIQ